MCGSLLTIALCPTHASIGIAAPILLVLARLLQGLSLDGEYGTSAAYLAEMATPKHRGFYTSVQYVTLIRGSCLQLPCSSSCSRCGWPPPNSTRGAGVSLS